MVLTDVVFKDFWDKTSKTSDPVVGSLVCRSEDVRQTRRLASGYVTNTDSFATISGQPM